MSHARAGSQLRAGMPFLTSPEAETDRFRALGRHIQPPPSILVRVNI
jgi:hypothetical protein